MVTFTNEKAHPVKLQYKLNGKFYNSGSQEAGVLAPFEETVVQHGDTFKFDGVMIAVQDLVGVPEQAGTPQDVVFGDVADQADGTVVAQNPHSGGLEQ